MCREDQPGNFFLLIYSCLWQVTAGAETQCLTNLWLNQPIRICGFNFPSFLTEGHITYPPYYRPFFHSHKNLCAKSNCNTPSLYTSSLCLKKVIFHAAASEYTVQLCVIHWAANLTEEMSCVFNWVFDMAVKIDPSKLSNNEVTIYASILHLRTHEE
jgi:hypothetical protein